MTTWMRTSPCPICKAGLVAVTFDYASGRAKPETTKLSNNCNCQYDTDTRVMLVGQAVAEWVEEQRRKKSREAA
jgi:hypothetical protein